MKKMYLAISSVLIAVAALVAVNVAGTNSLARSGARDCDNNSIIYCGALTQSELLGKYDKNVTKDLPQIYAHYGMSRSDLAGNSSQVKMGRVMRDGRVIVGGKTVATKAHSVGRFKSANSHPVRINGKTYYERTNTDNFLSDIDAFVLFRNGKFYKAVLTSCSNPVVATPVPTPPKPVYSCDALKSTKISRTEFSFTTDATAKNGATIVGYSYDFGDGKSASSTTSKIKHTYQKPGSYTVKVSVKVRVNGSTKMVTSTHCKTVVVVKSPPVVPLAEYSCTALTAKIVSLEDRSYEYELSYVAKNGARLASVDYDFGDNQFVTINGADEQKVSHTYTSAGSFTTVATLHFMVTKGDEVTAKSVKCEVSVSTSPEVCRLNPSLPKDDVRCQPCDVPGKEDLPKDSPKCVTPVTPVTPEKTETPQPEVTELPHTGLGDLLGSGLGIGSLTAASYYWRDSRRSLAAKLNNR